MKPINEMSLQECLEALQDDESFFKNPPYVYHAYVKAITRRISDLTRWIPVEERLPTEEDADKHGFVLVRQVENESPNRVYTYMERWSLILEPDYFYTTTHWQRIDTPEDK